MKKHPICYIFILLIAGSLAVKTAWALPSSYTEINLSNSSDPMPLEVRIDSEQSRAYGWGAGQVLSVQAYVLTADGAKNYLKDAAGAERWVLRLNEKAEGELKISPARDAFSGRLVVKANDKTLYATTPFLSESSGKILEKTYEYIFPDGAKIKVHYTDQILKETEAAPDFPREVLDDAVFAYQTITQFHGFNSKGFSFANPDKAYAYDPDKTIDIYIGNPDAENAYSMHGFSSTAFRDAPCFDTQKLSETSYQAVILLPGSYQKFIKNWEKLNPSPLGGRDVHVDLKGTLIHEMLHVIVFYYNKNLNKESHADDVRSSSPEKQVDWYVEGLARYFEMFAGARHDFFSQGFKQILPDKIRFSRGGSNYYMRYPDQPFTKLRYENALFWRFMDERFGMETIESMSRLLREDKNFEHVIEEAAQIKMSDLAGEYAAAILFKDFGFKEDSAYLKDIARTRLIYKEGVFYLVNGAKEPEKLGAVCRTDWIGEWENLKAVPGEGPIAGDNTEISDVSGLATDYVQIDFNTKKLPTLTLLYEEGGASIDCRVILETRAGSVFTKSYKNISPASAQKIQLQRWADEVKVDAGDIQKTYLLITNTDPAATARYALETD